MGALLVSGALAGLTVHGFQRDQPTADAAPTQRVGTAQQAVGLNRPARDGAFEFTVTTMECGIGEVGNRAMGMRAEGQYCKVSATIKNVGVDTRSFLASYQYAYGAAGERYGADATAQVYQGDGANQLRVSIGPGNVAAGTFFFDIPKAADIASLELHESAFSPGVTVTTPAMPPTEAVTAP